jgi:DNA-directed RNA polymerase specialized sigma24 family protein
MQNLLSLNEQYANYAAGLLEKKDFESIIIKIIRQDVHRFGISGWSREDYDDYVSSIYPRISRAIDVYQESGSSFESYIGTLVRLTAKEYRSRQLLGYMEETAAWITQLPEMYAHEAEALYNDHMTEETEGPVQLKNPRQLLILVLKCCNHVSTEFLEKVSPSVGVEPEALGKMITQLKEQREKREAEVMALRERINRHFYQCILFEKRLKVLAEGSIAAQRMKKQLAQKRAKLTNTRKQLAKKRLDPSNYQIAKLLGLSKGTVDTVLYKLKTRGCEQD